MAFFRQKKLICLVNMVMKCLCSPILFQEISVYFTIEFILFYFTLFYFIYSLSWREICPQHLPILGLKYTHSFRGVDLTVFHTHLGYTSITEAVGCRSAAPREQLALKCLAQVHLVSGCGHGEALIRHSPEPVNLQLLVQVPNQKPTHSNMHHLQHVCFIY